MLNINLFRYTPVVILTRTSQRREIMTGKQLIHGCCVMPLVGIEPTLTLEFQSKTPLSHGVHWYFGLYLKGQLTPIFNLISIRSTIPVHYAQTSRNHLRTESCFILNNLTKVNIKSYGDARKEPKLTSVDQCCTEQCVNFGFSQCHHQILLKCSLIYSI